MSASESVGLTVEEWCALVKRGASIPVTIPIMGTSMMPVIRYGVDLTTIVPLTRPPREGEIVLFRRRDGALIVHRVYQLLEDKVQTWGDNLRTPDVPVPREDVLGLVVSVRRGRRTVRLDTEEQRRRGIRWMHSPVRRRLWFVWNTVRWIPGKLIRKVWPDFRRERS